MPVQRSLDAPVFQHPPEVTPSKRKKLLGCEAYKNAFWLLRYCEPRVIDPKVSVCDLLRKENVWYAVEVPLQNVVAVLAPVAASRRR